MKKLIIICLLLFPFFAKAEVPENTFFFGDGKGYNVDGSQMYYCFGDGSCYSLEGTFAFVREVKNQLINLENRVSNLENNNMPNQIVAGVIEPEFVPKTVITENLMRPEAGKSYVQFIFNSNEYVQGATSKLEINGKTYENGKVVITRKGVGSYIIFDNLSLESGSYPYTFSLSNDLYEGTFNGDIVID